METLIEITSFTFNLDLSCHAQLFEWITKITKIENSLYNFENFRKVKKKDI